MYENVSCHFSSIPMMISTSAKIITRVTYTTTRGQLNLTIRADGKFLKLAVDKEPTERE